MSPLVSSLWVTLLGMALVFISILILWGLMEALMRITARYSTEKVIESKESEKQVVKEVEAASVAPDSDLKKRAAVAAVAIALSLNRPTARLVLPSSSRSAWQTVTRSSQLNQSSHIPRKSRGSK